MKIGLLGFGKAGKAVANVILQHTDFSLEWVMRNSEAMENLSAKEYLGISVPDPALIFSQQNISFEKLLMTHPVDIIIDFSTAESIYTYGKTASEKNIKIISAISHYGKDEIKLLKELSADTVVF